MKCDELKYEKLGDMMPFYPRSTLVIRKQFVDEAIAELIDIIKNNQSAYYVDLGIVATDCEKLKAENERLKKKKDDYHLMSDIRRAKIKELKRALWLARAERAKEKQNYESGCRSDGWVRRENMWLEVERLCRHKAKEYK